MPKVNLTASYGFLDPVTRQRRYYGPGQGIEVPQGLVNTLGLDVIPESIRQAQDEESPEIPPEPAAAPKPEATLLPADFPGRKYLTAVGAITLEQVHGLSFDDLVAIKGIGPKLAERIIEETNA